MLLYLSCDADFNVLINKITAPYRVKVEKCRVSYDAGVLKLSIQIQYESDISINPLSSSQSLFLQERNQHSRIFTVFDSLLLITTAVLPSTHTPAPASLPCFVITTHSVLEQ
jgi:hypothetical protein